MEARPSTPHDTICISSVWEARRHITPVVESWSGRRDEVVVSAPSDENRAFRFRTLVTFMLMGRREETSATTLLTAR